MTADLLILGAGIAGLSAALGACDRGAFPLVLDAGGPPEPGRRFDVLFDDDFTPVGGPMPTSLTWACTRVLGFSTPNGYRRRPGYVVDREALRQQLLTEVQRRGAEVAWHTPASWDGHRASAQGQDLPEVPVLLASSAFVPDEANNDRRIIRCWQGTGNPATSYLLTTISQAPAPILIAMTGANRWAAFGWQDPADAMPELPPGAELTFERSRRRARPETWPLCGPHWLRLGSAAGLEPAHGFGLAAKLALSRMTGWLAADMTLDPARQAAWTSYDDWIAPYRHWLHTAIGP
jgi:hypothetical protein